MDVSTLCFSVPHPFWGAHLLFWAVHPAILGSAPHSLGCTLHFVPLICLSHTSSVSPEGIAAVWGMLGSAVMLDHPPGDTGAFLTHFWVPRITMRKCHCYHPSLSCLSLFPWIPDDPHVPAAPQEQDFAASMPRITPNPCSDSVPTILSCI